MQLQWKATHVIFGSISREYNKGAPLTGKCGKIQNKDFHQIYLIVHFNLIYIFSKLYSLVCSILLYCPLLYLQASLYSSGLKAYFDWLLVWFVLCCYVCEASLFFRIKRLSDDCQNNCKVWPICSRTSLRTFLNNFLRKTVTRVGFLFPF